MHSDVRGICKKSTRDRRLIKLLKSPTLIVSASSVSKSFSKLSFLPKNPDDLCDRLKFLPQEKQAWNNSDKINEDIVGINDKLLEYKCISQKQHKQISIKCNLLHTK